MSDKVKISGVCLNLPEKFKEDEDATIVTHENLVSRETQMHSLSIGNGEMWIRGNKESLTNLVDSLIYRINHLPGD